MNRLTREAELNRNNRISNSTDWGERFRFFFRPAKYLVPAAIMALTVTGCDPEAPGGTGDNDGTVDDTTAPDTIIDVPSFNAPGSLAVSWLSSAGNYSIFYPALADMDGDGDLDLLVGYKGTVSSGSSSASSSSSTQKQGIVYLKNTASTGEAPQFSQDDSSFSGFPYREFYLSSYSYSSAAGPMIVSAGNVDSDGDVDIVAASNYYHHGDGSWVAAEVFIAKNNSSSFADAAYSYMGSNSSSVTMAPALADLDGDGDVDLVMGNAYSTSYSVYNSYSGFITYSSNSKQVLYVPNQDGNGDFLAYDLTPDNLVDPSPITGVFQLPIPSFVDIDDDGDLDMFTVMYDTGAVTFYLNTGTPTVPNFEVQTSAFGVLPNDGVKYFPAFGDMDGDGDMDLIAGTDDGRLLYVENTDINL